MSLDELLKKATPLPLITTEPGKEVALWGDSGARLFGRLSGEADVEPLHLNATLVAHCVNTYAELVGALMAVASDIDLIEAGSAELAYMVEAALEKAQNIDVKEGKQ